MARPSQAIIDLKALRHNYHLAVKLAPHSQNMAVIKANAYGHGAIAVGKALEPMTSAFAVASIEEAVELRSAGIATPILLLEGFFTVDELQLAVAHNFWLLLENTRQINQLKMAKLSKPATVWLKVDTGMHRLGVPLDQANQLYSELVESPNVSLPVVMASHFASADELDNDVTEQQIARLSTIAQPLSAPMSLANSPGLLAWPNARREWNRPGYMLYGNSPFSCPQENADQLVPVMTLVSQVMSLRTVAPGEGVGYGYDWVARRPSVIATIPIGYGDGYPRTARTGTPVLVNNQRCSLVGRVSMDLITVDVTDINSVELGNPVELWGKRLSIDEVAAPAGTIGYELLARMPARVPRIYEG